MTRLSPILLAGLLALVSACGGEPEPTSPEGGFATFRNALLEKDAEAVWETLSDDTRELFDEAHESLALMQELIRRLSPIDREAAENTTGVVLLSIASDGYELYRYLFYQEMIPDEQGFVVGLRERRVEYVDDTTAIVHTRGDQAFEMLHYDDGLWRVRSPIHESFAERIQRIDANRASLETAVSRFGQAGSAHGDVERLFGPDALRLSQAPPSAQ